MNDSVRAANSCSCPTGQAPTGLVATRGDPGREMSRKDAEAAGMEVLEHDDPRVKPDWEHECDVCGQSPIVPLTGLCGPCTFGESETFGGNW